MREMKNLMQPLFKRWQLMLLVFLTLYFIYLSIDEFNFINFYSYVLRVKGLFKFLSSLFLYGGLIMSMVMLLSSRNTILKVLSYLLLIITITIEGSYYIINGYGFTYSEASVALRETGFAGDAIKTFFPRIWFVFPSALIFGIFLYWVTERFLPKISWKFSIPITLFFVLLSYYVLKSTTGQQTYPSMFKIPVLAVFAQNHPIYMGSRDSVKVKPIKSGEYRHIIFLVDESVRGDMISLNDPKNDVTPYLLSISGKIYNYGIVSSGGNHSGNSQLIIRSGVKENFFPDTAQISLKKPDIFQFAKAAGYTTTLLDGQKDVLQNFMKESELDYIDNFRGIKEKGMKGEKIDFRIADYIVDLTKDTSLRTFTYVVKIGAHFNYENYYPADQKIYSPTMKLGEMNYDRAKMVNSYKNVVRWNVDNFFKYLIDKLGNRKDYIIIYTSDHGQTLMEHNIISTHADVKNAHPLQACVPFFVYFPDTIQKNKFNYNEQNYNHLSHFNLFPSILLMMGYDTTYVNENYDKSIFDTVDSDRYFYTGMLFMEGNGFKTLFDTPEITQLMKNIKKETSK